MGAREFFAGLPSRIDPERLRGESGSYRFEVEGAGTWRIEIDDGAVSVSEDDGPADCVIRTSEETFERVVVGTQNPSLAFMTGKIQVEGDMGLALKLQKLFS